MAPKASRGKDDNRGKLHRLSLKGSAKLVAEFFQYSIHTILFQRGVYPAEDFASVKKYGLNMLVSCDEDVKAYIKQILGQLDRWMQQGKIKKLVIVITDKDTLEPIERWQFDVDIFNTDKDKKAKPTGAGGGGDGDENAAPAANSAPRNASTISSSKPAAAGEKKTEEMIQAEIRALFRQITASVTFLPQLEGNCSFNVLVYADGDSEVPVDWGDSDAKEIANAESVQLRGFSTANHRVGTMVSYRLDE